jgi:hypothetical protein
MNEEEALKWHIDDCQKQCDWVIRRIKYCQTMRQVFAATNGLVQLGFACLYFYHLKYGWAIFSVVFGMALASLSWWSITKSIREWRTSKLRWAELKLRGQKLLTQWRGYK